MGRGRASLLFVLSKSVYRRYLLAGLLLTVFLFPTQSRSEIQGIATLLAMSSVGVTERHEDNDYAKKLGIDPRVTVLIHYGPGLCTGTFLSDTVVLTAAHCVDWKNKKVPINVEGIDSVQVLPHPEYRGQLRGQGQDIAFAIFPKGTGEFLGIKKYPPLATSPAQPKEKIYLVGFGMGEFYAAALKDRDSGSGVRGWGTTELESAGTGVLYTGTRTFLPPGKSEEKKSDSPKGEAARALPGDSGGAVYNEPGEIVAVVSILEMPPITTKVGKFFGIPINRIDGWQVRNEFTDVTLEKNQALAYEAENLEAFESIIESFKVGKFFDIALETPDPDSFGHVTLRTGRYEATDDKGKAMQWYVRPHYKGKTLELVVVRERIDNKYSPERLYICVQDKCINREMTKFLELGKAQLKAYELAPLPDGKLQPKNPVRFQWTD